MSDLVGKQFGNYRLLRFLAEGSFAEVYVGEHIRLNTLAAIKVLGTRLTAFETGDFLTEARTVANLDHRNIVRILDCDVEGHIPFLVLEYAPNGSLRQRHPKGTRLPPQTILSYVKQISAGLQYAHDKRLIHRDVKPENILLKRDNELLLSDFGLAILVRSTQSLTLDKVIGTPNYMAPEQTRGKPCAASDQYALGVMVYEWISGIRPFTGSLSELIAQHQFATPAPLDEQVPDIPSAVEEVVLQALAKEPIDRYPCVQDFADALNQAIRMKAWSVHTSTESYSDASSLREEDPTLPSALPAIMPALNVASLPPQLSIPAVPAASQSQLPSHNIPKHKIPRRKVVQWGVVMGISTLTAATVIDYAVHAFGSRQTGVSTNIPPHHTPVSTPPFGTLLYSPYINRPFKVFSVAWSHDGKHIASGWDDNIARVQNAATGKIISQYSRHTNYVKTVSWSPNSTLIASGSLDNTVRIWNAATELDILTPPYTGHTKAVRSVAWSLNGTHIVSGSEDNTVRVWNAATGIDISHSPFTGHNGIVYSVAWSIDGIHIASASADSTVKVWNIQTGQNTFTYRSHQKGVRVVAWSPDGKYIASGSEDNTVRVWDAATGIDILPAPYKGHNGAVYTISWSSDGKRIASGCAKPDKTVQVWNATTGGQAQPYRQHKDDVWGVSWSPDGKYIASGSFDYTVQVWWAI